ncbi:MAG: DUF4255 domain-containing protein [Anaeromicrobium sp.]|uniref:DUF4255 domain-containing protein n=1 Tax=Anaeromicrobium sp. TaxID=1929132 RepID=UPI0025F9F8B2|nr:DUF4255 domain-containing protein [Anaeromicrobium sp.]MCT4593105.1 DUF4255 domain-containing protein [Anaeromicrobium sp.]
MITIPAYTAIADVGSSLVKLLQENLVPEPIDKKENIGLCSPADKGDFQLTLYLYNIEESGEFRQTEMIKLPDGNLRYPPISFNLYYLLTAYSTAELKSKALDEHKILGRAIQVLYDNAILRGNDLAGSLKGSDQDIRIQTKNLSYDEMMRIWNFNDVPYNLSIAYRVGPVLIDSTRIKEAKRVVDTKISIMRKDRR